MRIVSRPKAILVKSRLNSMSTIAVTVTVAVLFFEMDSRAFVALVTVRNHPTRISGMMRRPGRTTETAEQPTPGPSENVICCQRAMRRKTSKIGRFWEVDDPRLVG